MILIIIPLAKKPADGGFSVLTEIEMNPEAYM